MTLGLWLTGIHDGGYGSLGAGAPPAGCPAGISHHHRYGFSERQTASLASESYPGWQRPSPICGQESCRSVSKSLTLARLQPVAVYGASGLPWPKLLPFPPARIASDTATHAPNARFHIDRKGLCTERCSTSCGCHEYIPVGQGAVGSPQRLSGCSDSCRSSWRSPRLNFESTTNLSELRRGSCSWLKMVAVLGHHPLCERTRGWNALVDALRGHGRLDQRLAVGTGPLVSNMPFDGQHAGPSSGFSAMSSPMNFSAQPHAQVVDPGTRCASTRSRLPLAPDIPRPQQHSDHRLSPRRIGHHAT